MGPVAQAPAIARFDRIPLGAPRPPLLSRWRRRKIISHCRSCQRAGRVDSPARRRAATLCLEFESGSWCRLARQARW